MHWIPIWPKSYMDVRERTYCWQAVKPERSFWSYKSLFSNLLYLSYCKRSPVQMLSSSWPDSILKQPVDLDLTIGISDLSWFEFFGWLVFFFFFFFKTCSSYIWQFYFHSRYILDQCIRSRHYGTSGIWMPPWTHRIFCTDEWTCNHQSRPQCTCVLKDKRLRLFVTGIRCMHVIAGNRHILVVWLVHSF